MRTIKKILVFTQRILDIPTCICNKYVITVNTKPSAFFNRYVINFVIISIRYNAVIIFFPFSFLLNRILPCKTFVHFSVANPRTCRGTFLSGSNRSICLTWKTLSKTSRSSQIHTPYTPLLKRRNTYNRGVIGR